MLFPAVYKLGFRAGQVVHALMLQYYSDSTTIKSTTTTTRGGGEGLGNDDDDNNNVISKLMLLLFSSSTSTSWDALTSIPMMYKDWWLNLVMNDPLHVCVETTLLVSIIYMIVSRSTEGYKHTQQEKLTQAEQEELIDEWVRCGRMPLASSTEDDDDDDDVGNDDHHDHDHDDLYFQQPSSNNNNNKKTDDKEKAKNDEMLIRYRSPPEVVVHKHLGRYMEIQYIVPTKKEMINNLSSPRKSNNRKSFSRSSSYPSYNKRRKSKTITTTPTNQNEAPKPDLIKVLNFATFDFLGMAHSDDPTLLNNDHDDNNSNTNTTTADSTTNTSSSTYKNPIKEASAEALKHYGCGSCGPRGFYGTIDTHLTLEENISKFTKTDGAIMYSDGASTCSSTVAAFAKRGDVLVVDEGVYEPLITGVMLSRANVKWFKHNDMDDLERVLKQVQQTDKSLNRKPNAQRRFIIVEGLYKNLGTICPLDKLIELKHKFNYRLLLDESFSFGTLGSTGRGALELYNKRPMYDAEVMTIALENSLGSIGGVTVGNEEVVDHQRLSGAGYCFSASAPPFTATAASTSLQLLESEPKLISTLHTNIIYMNEQLRTAMNNRNHHYNNNPSSSLYQFVITSDERSPIIVLHLEQETDREADLLCGVAHECLLRNIAVVATGREPVASGHLRTELAPAIRLTVSSLHTKDDIDKAVSVLMESFDIVTGRYSNIASPRNK